MADLVVWIESRVNVNPQSACTDMGSGMFATESDVIKARHVYRHTVRNVGKTSVWTVPSTFDSKLAAMLGEVGDDGRHILW